MAAGESTAVMAGELVGGFAAYQRYRGFSEATVHRRTWTITNLALHVEPRPLSAVTRRDVIAFLAKRRAPQTRHSLLCDIRQFYRWAIRDGDIGITANPTDGIESPKLGKRAPTPLTRDQIFRALVAAPSAATHLAIVLGAYAGLRVSEIAALHSDNLAHPGRLVVRAGKGGKDRIIPVAPELALAIARHMAGRVGPVFPGATANSISERIRRTFRAAGINARPHDLRHSFATAAARRSNGNVILVAGLLGHADTKTTQRYIGWYPAGAEVVDDLYDDPDGSA